MSKIEIKALNKNYYKKQVLKNINCTLDNGVYGILGPNGAGKTTLMRCITELCSYNGKILINGIPVGKSHLKIGYLPQSFCVFKELTVWDMMQYFCNLKKIPKKARREEIERCLELVHLENEKKTRSSKLSGGMLRRLGIAQAIIGSPQLIILDEPTAGLDPEERLHFSSIINRLEKNSIVMISTHIVEDVEACCEKIIVMNHGEILKIAPLESIRRAAEQKVVELEAGTNRVLSEEDCLLVEKEYQRDGKLFQRVLTWLPQQDSMEPTVEDGYLFLLHQTDVEWRDTNEESYI